VLRFQGLQAMVYQLIGLAFKSILLVLVSFTMQFVSMLVFLLVVPASNPSNNNMVFILIMIPFLALFFIFALALLLGPLYQTFALIAAWQVSHDGLPLADPGEVGRQPSNRYETLHYRSQQPHRSRNSPNCWK